MHDTKNKTIKLKAKLQKLISKRLNNTIYVIHITVLSPTWIHPLIASTLSLFHKRPPAGDRMAINISLR